MSSSGAGVAEEAANEFKESEEEKWKSVAQKLVRDDEADDEICKRVRAVPIRYLGWVGGAPELSDTGNVWIQLADNKSGPQKCDIRASFKRAREVSKMRPASALGGRCCQHEFISSERSSSASQVIGAYRTSGCYRSFRFGAAGFGVGAAGRQWAPLAAPRAPPERMAPPPESLLVRST